MERISKLRIIQLKESAKYSLYIALSVVVFASFFLAADPNTKLFNFNNLWLGLLSIVSFIIQVMALVIPLIDGMSDFDAAIRFGVSRKKYFVFNIILYVILAIFRTIFVHFDGIFAQINEGTNQLIILNQMHFQETLEQILVNFTVIMILALLGYAFYRFGWKILIWGFVIINLIFGLMFGAISMYENGKDFLSLFRHILNFINENFGLIFGLSIIIIIGLYYLVIQKQSAKQS